MTGNRLSPVPKAPLCLALLALSVVPASAGPVRYRVTDLVPGPDSYYASSVNDAGQVVVSLSAGGNFDPVFLYDDGALRSLDDFTQASSSAINNRGQVVGSAAQIISTGDLVSSRALLYEGGVVRDLGVLPGTHHAAADGINDRGQVVGSAFDLAGFSPEPVAQPTRPFLWEGGTMRDLGTLAGFTDGVARAVNDAGQVVGYSFSEASGPRAFLYENGAMRDLGVLPGAESSNATDINETGQVVGDSGGQAFLYEAGAMRGLEETLRGATGSDASAINDVGQVVGVAWVNEFGEPLPRAFLYEDGEMLDLNDLIPSDSGWTLSTATAINGRGWIVGTGLVPATDEFGEVYQQERAYLLTPTGGGPGPGPIPIPLPPALWTGLTVLGGIIAWQSARRREHK